LHKTLKDDTILPRKRNDGESRLSVFCKKRELPPAESSFTEKTFEVPSRAVFLNF